VQCPDPPGTVGDGGWWVSIQDLARWLDALNRGELGHEVTAMMEQPGRLNDGTPLDYAWGVRVRPHRAGRLITHGGTWPGWLSKTVRIPEAGIAVAVLCHGADETATSNLGLALAEHLVPLVVARR
jgi:CubicO group peptidase (beta-lactamase class C family)